MRKFSDRSKIYKKSLIEETIYEKLRSKSKQKNSIKIVDCSQIHKNIQNIQNILLILMEINETPTEREPNFDDVTNIASSNES